MSRIVVSTLRAVPTSSHLGSPCIAPQYREMERQLGFLPARIVIVSNRNALPYNHANTRRSRRATTCCAAVKADRNNGDKDSSPDAVRGRRSRRNEPIRRKFSEFPALLRGPEAVLGIPLVAGALAYRLFSALGTVVANARQKGKVDSQTSLLPQEIACSVPDKQLFLHQESDVIATLTGELESVKGVLQETESKLDDTLLRAKAAEEALETGNDLRLRLHEALSSSNDAEQALNEVRHVLSTKKSRADSLKREKAQISKLVESLDKDLDRNRRDIQVMETQIANACDTSESGAPRLSEKIRLLKQRSRILDVDLEAVKGENDRLLSERDGLENEVRTLTEQVQEGEKNLASFQSVVSGQAVEEMESEENRNWLIVKLETELRDARTALQSLQTEMADIDTLADTEMNSLKSALGAREVEISHLRKQLELLRQSTNSGGDPTQSELSLKQVDAKLEAEQIKLHAMINHASLERDRIEDEVDLIDSVRREMEVDEGLLKADLRLAQSDIEAKEYERQRKEKDIQSVTDNLDKQEDFALARQKASRSRRLRRDSPMPSPTQECSAPAKRRSLSRKSLEGKSAVVPKRRPGRPRKSDASPNTAISSTDSSVDNSERSDPPLKRKRGRPRKNQDVGGQI